MSVGNKYSYADLAWVPWQVGLAKAFTPEDEFNLTSEYPAVTDWIARMNAREAVQYGIAMTH